MSFQNVAYSPDRHTAEQNVYKLEDTNRILINELTRCGIDVIVRPDLVPNSEPYTNITGKFGRLAFARAWYYWRVYGLVPLDVAEKIYAHPVGKTDVRVDGHCGRIAPVESRIKWLHHEKRKLIASNKSKEDFEKLIKSYQESDLKDREKWIKRVYEEYIYSDDPASIGGTPYISNYHIDSELGLYVFMQHVKEYADIHNEITWDTEK